MYDPHTRASLLHDLQSLGVSPGDSVFVHSAMGAIGPTVGGPRCLVEAMIEAVGEAGLIGMPGFSTDAYFPAGFDLDKLTASQIRTIEAAVLGFDPARSSAREVGIIAETFRTWPETKRSHHPSMSVCLRGDGAEAYVQNHSLDWATGPDTPFGRMYDRANMKVLLIGVGWNRCTPLHTAETLADVRRVKTHRVKHCGVWRDSPDVADDLNRLFPAVGAAFEETGQVTTGTLGNALCRVCDYRQLVDFAADWISAANLESGDRA